MSGNLCACMYAWIKADKNRRLKYCFVMLVFVLGVVLIIKDYNVSTKEIQGGLKRNSYGEGGRTEELEVSVDGNSREKIHVDIAEKIYDEAGIQKLFQICTEEIEKEFLGENETAEYVTKNLNLMTALEGRPVEISWTLDNYDVLNVYGEIQKEKLSKEGTMVNLEAVISYTEESGYQSIYTRAVVIYPEILTEEERVKKQIEDKIQENEDDSRHESVVELPDSVDGKNLHFYQSMNERGGILILMSVLMGILFYVQEFKNREQEIKKRHHQMIMDYPEIINKLTLFLGAGMTLKRAWRKIVADYEAEKTIWGIRPAYEEMKISCREMESGVTEAESYERFGRRCNIQEYMRLGALLSQNLRKGTKGLNHVLRLEALQAFENRKAAAKKMGEEAGTKLLVPMFIMFTVVLIMVIVPAFLSMQF